MRLIWITNTMRYKHNGYYFREQFTDVFQCLELGSGLLLTSDKPLLEVMMTSLRIYYPLVPNCLTRHIPIRVSHFEINFHNPWRSPGFLSIEKLCCTVRRPLVQPGYCHWWYYGFVYRWWIYTCICIRVIHRRVLHCVPTLVNWPPGINDTIQGFLSRLSAYIYFRSCQIISDSNRIT